MILQTTDETERLLINFVKAIYLQDDFKLARIQSAYGTEFENTPIDVFCSENGIQHHFSALRTPQQNGVVETKNQTLVDIDRTMSIHSVHAMNIWAEAVNIACYIT